MLLKFFKDLTFLLKLRKLLPGLNETAEYIETVEADHFK
jgi:hypothetical protein